MAIADCSIELHGSDCRGDMFAVVQGRPIIAAMSCPEDYPNAIIYGSIGFVTQIESKQSR